MMTPVSGRETLAEIRQAFDAERARLRDVDARIARANERIVELDAARTAQLEVLARVRVGEPAATDGAAGDAGRPASDVDARVAAMLEARRTERAELEATLRDLDAEAARGEKRHDALTDELEAASDELDAAEAATQERLDADPAYRATRERAHELQATARHAEEKAAQSEEERAAKGRAYEDDPFFTYLWRRGYGGDRYRASSLTRLLDRRIARMIGYDGARANYARLRELPGRLREHAERVAAAAEEALAELRRLDERARAEDGIDELQRRREAAEEALERHDAETARIAEERQRTFDRLERMDRGEDEAYVETVGFLASQLQREELRDLREAALATPHPEDDAVVERLLALEGEREELADRVADLKEVADAARARMRELQETHREFLQRHYGEPGTDFFDGDLVGTVLEQVLRGATARGVLWRVLEEQQRGPRRRSDPTFGSGGFGRGSPWSGGSWPRSGGRGMGPFGGGLSGGGFGGGGLSRGSFRTGGSMRGGGFRTGGKR